MKNSDLISTTSGRKFSREKFDALINVREIALKITREFLKLGGYSEVTTSSLVNIQAHVKILILRLD